jgi:hypothetical protein
VELILHFTWTYITPTDRCQVIEAYPAMRSYVDLRLFATTQSVATLRRLRPPPGKPTTLDPRKARLYGAALLRFNFIYGDFVRWLSSEYTNRHRDWATTFNTFAERKARPPPAHLPPADFLRGFCINTEGVPLAGHYVNGQFVRAKVVSALTIPKLVKMKSAQSTRTSGNQV